MDRRHRRAARGRGRPRPAAGQHQHLLVHPQRRLGGALRLRDRPRRRRVGRLVRAGLGGARRCRAPGAGPVRRRRPAPQGARPRPQDGPLDRVRRRRPLRRPGGPRPPRGRPAGLLPRAAVTRRAVGAATVLTRRTLNRTTLGRQGLQERAAVPALDMVGQLIAVQAQEPDAPYLGLWTRLEAFAHDELARLLEDRRVVRSTVLRGTQHLVRADDYLWLRPLVQPVLERVWRGTLGRRTDGVDPAELATATRGLLAGRTLTRSQLRDLLAERWPDRDRQALAWAAQALVPVVHPPPAGTWGRRGAVPLALAEEWLGRPLAAPAPETLLRRYLAAFGPASVADVQAWSGLTRL